MKRAICLLIVAAMVFSAAAAFAGSEFVQDTKKAGKASAKYTGDVVKGTADTVGYAAKGTTEVAVSPFVAFWKSITGQGKAEKIVTDPVNKAGKTVYDTSVNTGNTVTGKGATRK
jgi:hypothetical protein